MAAAGAAVLVAITAGLLMQYRGRLESDIRRLAGEMQDLRSLEVRVNEAANAAERIGRWADVEVVWLEELRRLSEGLPPADEVMFTQLTASPTTRGAEVRLEGLARDPQTFDAMEQGLRGEGYRVEGRGRSHDTSVEPYSWRFTTSWFIDKTSPQ